MSVKVRNTQSVVMARLGVWSCFSYSSGTDTTLPLIWCYQLVWESIWKEYEHIEMLFPSAECPLGRERGGGQCLFLKMCLIQQGTKT